MSDYLTVKQFHASEGVEDWRVISEGATAFFPTASFAQAAQFVQAIASLSGVQDHVPGVDIREDGVTVRLVTLTTEHMGMSERDLALARAISGVARVLGLVAEPGRVQSLLVIPGAPNVAEVMPFWQAVLGYVPRPDSPAEDIIDPRDRGPAFWFEQMEQPRGDGGGAIHLAVWVPAEQAQVRIAAALAAGGRMVRDGAAPSWWTLADAAGNEIDVATTTGRD